MGMSRKQGRLIDTRLMMAIEIIAVATALDFCPGKQANRQSSAPPLVRASSLFFRPRLLLSVFMFTDAEQSPCSTDQPRRLLAWHAAADGLEQSTRLTYLDVSFNKLGHVGVECIEAAVRVYGLCMRVTRDTLLPSPPTFPSLHSTSSMPEVALRRQKKKRIRPDGPGCLDDMIMQGL